MNCDQVRELLEAYVLDALDVEESLRVEKHLVQCSDCQRLAAELAEVVHTLPEALAIASATQLRPRPSMKDEILQAIKSAPEGAAADDRPHLKSGGQSTTPTRAASIQQKPDRPPAARRRWWSLPLRPRMVGFGLVLVLLVLSIAWAARLTVALAQERALRTELADLVGQQEIVFEVVDSDKAVRRVLLPPEPVDDPSTTPYGKLFTRTDLPHVVAMAARLPQPLPGQAYHLWLTRGDETWLAGEMSVNDDGFGLLLFDADRDGPVYDVAQLTLQPLGNNRPTAEPIISWSASN